MPYQENFRKAYEFFQQEIEELRTGRVTPALVENISVDAYGTPMPVKQVASITIPDAKTIAIQPWDKGQLKNIEAALQKSALGVAPKNDGLAVYLNFPPLTEENRKQLVKILAQKAEAARVSVRQVRDKEREEIQKKEKAKEMGEDEKFRLQKHLDEETVEWTGKVNDLQNRKEEEIMVV
ncbi:MAG: ribosome recycling factor [Parcubacteria group bacterium CG2_30_48_51]|nr:MAG: ribosome recycling factor [Parcubacteria group bacterium CG2_30_48_51]